jgi:hypothetical protein
MIMAFVDLDAGGDSFVNVTHRVGKGGDWDDLLVVQLMLELVYANFIPLKKTKPTKGPVTVSGKPAADTPILIAHFQKIVLKRSKPQGFINKAVGTAKAKEGFTIWMLNVVTSNVLAFTRSPDSVITFLVKKAPLLASKFQSEGAQGIGEIIMESLPHF